MARKYNTYLFVEPPKNAGGLSTGLNFSNGNPREPLLSDIADLAEMAARRYFLGCILPTMTKTEFATYKANSDNKAFITRHIGFHNKAPQVYYDIGGNHFAISTPDGKGPPQLRNGTQLPLPSSLSGALHGFYVLTFTRSEIILDWPVNIIKSNKCSFLSEEWALEDWIGESDYSTFSYTARSHRSDIANRQGSITRIRPPDKTLFSFVNDAVYARPLDTRTFSYKDYLGATHTITTKVPPYSPWYNPSGSSYKTTVNGQQVRSWGTYEGGASIHTDPLLTFPVDKTRYTDSFLNDELSQVSTIPVRVMHDHIANLAPDSINSNQVFYGRSLVPPLHTQSSWWEQNQLGAAEGNSTPSTVELDEQTASTVSALYTAPAIIPSLPSLELSTLPTSNYTHTSEGDASETFKVRTLHRASMSHAKSLLEKLHKVVIKVPCARIEFSATSESSYQNTHSYEVNPSHPPINRTYTAKGNTGLTSQGWTEIKCDASSSAFGGGVIGLGGTLKGSGHSESVTGTFGLVDRITTGMSNPPLVVETTSDNSKATFITECKISSIIPTRSAESKNYTLNSGSHTTSETQAATRKPDLLVPSGILPFVKDAELIIVLEVITREVPDINTKVVLLDYEVSPFPDQDATATVQITQEYRVQRKAISLGRSKTLQFGPVDYVDLLNQNFPVKHPGHSFGENIYDSVPEFGDGQLGGSLLDLCSNTTVTGYGSCTYKPELDNESYIYDISAEGSSERTITKAAMFLVIDFDPDVDNVNIWALDNDEKASELYGHSKPINDAGEALEEAESELAKATDLRQRAEESLQDAINFNEWLQEVGEDGWSDHLSNKISTLNSSIHDAELEVESAQQARDEAEELLTQAAGSAQNQAANYHQATSEGGDSEGNLQSWLNSNNAEHAAYDNLMEKEAILREKEDALAALRDQLAQVQQELSDGYRKALETSSAHVQSMQAALTEAEAALASAQENVNSARDTLSSAISAYNSILQEIKDAAGGWAE